MMALKTYLIFQQGYQTYYKWSSGIAVGMATTLLLTPTEVIDACSYILDNPETTADDSLKIVKGPDFPLGNYHWDRWN